MKSNMPPQQNFSQIQNVSMSRSVFNRTHTHKTTFFENLLIPIYVDEILPGDSVDFHANIFARLSSTLDFPIMDNMFLDLHSFFVPYRILWVAEGLSGGSWEKFMGERKDPGDPIDFEVPQVTATAAQNVVEGLSDYLGIPPNLIFTESALFHRGYIKIYNDFYRDENLIDSIQEVSGDGPDLVTEYPLQVRGKRHDYFTSCLPQPQKGDEVTIGLIGQAPVIGDGGAMGIRNGTQGGTLWMDASAGPAFNADLNAFGKNVGDPVGSPTNMTTAVYYGLSQTLGESGMIADLTGAAAITINDFRLAVATQQLLELDNRGGTRYFEILKAHFGVTSPDSRMQRPEFLQGSTQMINVNPVTQTSESNTTFQGEQAAYVTANGSAKFSKSFVEHGMVMTIMSVRADLTYQQGLNRMFSRKERYDFYFPTFANLGEQAVLRKEIQYSDTTNDDLVFGYNERWSEYRYKPSLITGRFRSGVTDSLDAWHLAQDFADFVTLNQAFIEESMPLNRVLTVPSSATVPSFIMDSHIKIRHTRVMPTYSTPGLKRL